MAPLCTQQIVHRADFIGQDFTVTDSNTDGLSVIETNLSNSNFEGVNLSPKAMYQTVLDNKAYLISGGTIETPEAGFDMIKEDLFPEFTPILLMDVEVGGNDLAVTYLLYNNFRSANLENANFIPAVLWNANFYSADLTNADLSGADLSYAFPGNADKK